ncbi:MAG: hypothetical protein NTU44_13910 [Bacteroidetes bacterium]|nr:hypothetical protein [Bacteroidota bacterium]
MQIGTQCWMKENLNVGTKVSGATNASDNGIIEKYCYNNDANNCLIYGGLYHWDEMMQYNTSEGIQGICPIGWHIPTYAEWLNLINFLGGFDLAGGKMKETGFDHWNDPNTGATNESRFTALGGGYGSSDGTFNLLNYSAYFWSSTQFSSSNAYYYYLYFNSANAYRNNYYKTNRFSVRCLKNN